MKIYQIVEKSRANGPGVRFTLWVQGCKRKCDKCSNPETHDPKLGYPISVDAILYKIRKNIDVIDGVSISGGEPLEQFDELLQLIKRVKEEMKLSVIIWTGYEIDEVISMKMFNQLANYTDLLITGPYIHTLRKPEGLRGSSNQEYVFFTEEYSEKDLENIPFAEIHFHDEQLQITGINTEEIKGWFE